MIRAPFKEPGKSTVGTEVGERDVTKMSSGSALPTENQA